MRSARKLGLAGLAGFMAISGSFAVAQLPNQPEEQAAARFEDDEAARELCKAIIEALADLPLDAGTTDIEAAIVFAISQSPYLQRLDDIERRDRIINEALDCVAGQAQHTNLATAIANVRAAYSVGTGAIGGRSGSTGGGFSNFGPPLVGIGGGGANYTSAS